AREGRPRRGHGAAAAAADAGRRLRFAVSVTVTPEEFTLVLFDAPTIEATLSDLMSRLGLAERSLQVSVDETTPIVRTSIQAGEPIVLEAGSGAFEDPRLPRHLSTLPV